MDYTPKFVVHVDTENVYDGKHRYSYGPFASLMEAKKASDDINRMIAEEMLVMPDGFRIRSKHKPQAHVGVVRQYDEKEMPSDIAEMIRQSPYVRK